MIPVNELIRGYNLYQKEYEDKAIEVLRSGWYILGKEVEGFENEFSKALGTNVYVAGVDNGLNAIHLGLLASGIGEGDEIIVQANGYIATIFAVIQCGATPIFVEPNVFFNIDASKIEKAITKKTKAILVTHLYGQATEMEEIITLCKKYNLMLFEDCAQCHFATYKGIYTGLFGDASFFSFYPTKNLGAYGDGGAVVSKNKHIIEKVKILRNYGSDYRYHNIELGFNSRLDELQAGLLRVKLGHFSDLVENRRYYANLYLKKIDNTLVELPRIANDSTHIWYQFVVRVKEREIFRKYMENNGIKTDINWEIPPYLQPSLHYLGYKKGDFPITECICDEIVSLPLMDYMTEEELESVIHAVNSYKI